MIKALNKLSESQKKEIHQLVHDTNEEDQTHDEAFLSHELTLHQEMKTFFLYYKKGVLVGFLCIFADTHDVAEITGAVLPDYRKAGIFSELLDEAKSELLLYGYTAVIFAINTNVSHAIQWAVKKRATLDRKEYFMYVPHKIVENNVLTNPRIKGLKKEIICKIATEENFQTLTKIHASAFDSSEALAKFYLKKSFESPKISVYEIEYEDKIVGSCCVDCEGIYQHLFGLCITPEYQGQLIGTNALLQLITELQSKSKKKVSLEVDVKNKAALRLYKSCGFEILSEYAYYELPFGYE